MARRFARLVVVVAGFVFLTAIAWAQTQPQAQVQTENQLLTKLTQDPSQVGTYLDLAKLYSDQGRLVEAEGMLQRAMGALQALRQQQLQQTTGTRALLPLSADVGGTPVRVGNGIKEPSQIKYVAPVYPEIARTARVSGVVILEITIDPTGVVSGAKVLRPVALLDQAAVDAVKQWRFSPTTVNGVAVPVLMTVTVNFGVADSAPTSAATVPPGALPFEVNAITTTSVAASGQPVRVGGDIREPKKIRDVKPVYPREAQAARAQGTVIMEVVIDVYGSVSDVKLLRPGNQLLDNAAMDAVRQWKFMPTTVNGTPVSVIMTITMSFTLGGRM